MSHCTSERKRSAMHVEPPEQPSSTVWWSGVAILFLSLKLKCRLEVLVFGKCRRKMVKPARTSQRNNSVSFSRLPYFCLIHFFNKDHTHAVLCQGCILFLLACSFKIPGCIHYCFKTTILHRKALSEEKHHGFSWAGERPKSPVLVPLPAFPPCDFLSFHSFSGSLQEVKYLPTSSLLCLAGSCGFSCCRRYLLPVLAVYQPLRQDVTLKLTVGAAAAATSRDGWHHSEERRSAQKGLPSCATATGPSWKKTERFQSSEDFPPLSYRWSAWADTWLSHPHALATHQQDAAPCAKDSVKLSSSLIQCGNTQLREFAKDAVSAFMGTDLAGGRKSLNWALKAVGSCPMKEELRSGLQKEYLKCPFSAP